jgi:hypothetical protein
MFEERRATVSKTELNGDGNGGPKTVWSLNLSTAQLVLGNITKLIGVIAIVWGMVNWSAGNVFTRELERFHKEAIPQIERMIDSRVLLQDALAAAALADRLDEINQRLARIEGTLGRAEVRDLK